MKFCAGIIVLNGMPWIPYLLRNLYPMMDQIVVVEGAVLHAAEFADAHGRSLDGTVEALRAFSDPEDKITIIQKDGFWTEKDEMSAAYAGECRCDYLWQVDSDEFYLGRDVQVIKNLLVQQPEIGAISFKAVNLFGGMQGVIKGARFAYGEDQFWRLFRWGAGYRYVAHRAPTVADASGLDTRQQGVLTGNHLARDYGIYLYHYSYVLPQQVMQKSIYYERLDLGYRRYSDMYYKHFQRFTPYRVFKDTRPLSWLEPFRLEHPPEIQQAIADSQAGRLPYDLATRPEVARLLNSWWRWRLWKVVGLADVLLWWVYDRPFRSLMRPIVRLFRARFFGYDYSIEKG